MIRLLVGSLVVSVVKDVNGWSVVDWSVDGYITGELFETLEEIIYVAQNEIEKKTH